MVIFVNRQIELVMKTLVSLLCCTALTVGSASAQSYRVARAGAFEENGRVEVGIPTSPLAVDLTVEKEVVTVGPYARYAQKFLGVRGALSDKTLYSVKAARVALLDRDATTASEVPAGEVRATSYLGDAETFSRVPFDKRSLVDESLETAARNAANTLFAIRRHRMELITSEAGEHVFGAGLQAALAELDRQEQAYTELFLGRTDHRRARCRQAEIHPLPLFARSGAAARQRPDGRRGAVAARQGERRFVHPYARFAQGGAHGDLPRGGSASCAAR